MHTSAHKQMLAIDPWVAARELHLSYVWVSYLTWLQMLRAMPDAVADVSAVPPKSDYAKSMNADANKGQEAILHASTNGFCCVSLAPIIQRHAQAHNMQRQGACA